MFPWARSHGTVAAESSKVSPVGGVWLAFLRSGIDRTGRTVSCLSPSKGGGYRLIAPNMA